MGCALSPLIGAFYLQMLDEALGNSGLYYVRYMDDVLILAPTRWRLRKAVRVLQQTFAHLKLRTHPDKTSIGRIEKGFDFLGYHFSCGPLRLAHQTIQHFAARLYRLYEQQKRAPEGALILGKYVTRWLRWTRAGLRELDRQLLLSPTAEQPEAS
jgi:RNA-directed DNA polymerase